MLKYYFNRIYEDNIDVIAIIDAIQPEIDSLNEKTQDYFYDAFPATATMQGIVRWENIFGIVADPSSEDIEFRRARIINRFLGDIPYTERALQNVMNNIMGAGNWSYELDYRNYELSISSLRHGKNWMNEMELTLKKMVPANIKYALNIWYNQHQALSDYTHEYLGQFTHLQIREEDLG